MTYVNSGNVGEDGAVRLLARANVPDAERLRSQANGFGKTAASVRKPDRMPNGDPPSLVLWGTEEEK
jgi:hypothetical protein